MRATPKFLRGAVQFRARIDICLCENTDKPNGRCHRIVQFSGFRLRGLWGGREHLQKIRWPSVREVLPGVRTRQV